MIPLTDSDIDEAVAQIDKCFSYKEPTGYQVEECQLPNGKWLRVEVYPDNIYKYYVWAPHTYKKGRASDVIKRIARLWCQLGRPYAGMDFTQFMAKMLKQDAKTKRYHRRVVPKPQVHGDAL